MPMYEINRYQAQVSPLLYRPAAREAVRAVGSSPYYLTDAWLSTLAHLTIHEKSAINIKIF